MIVLLQMPYAAIEHPSIALGLLQAECQRSGLAVRSLYPNLQWRELLGSEVYHAISGSVTEDLVGEWTFARAAFDWTWEQEQAYLEMVCSRGSLANFSGAMEMLLEVRQKASQFIDKLATEILSLNPRIVGASSTFQQHCASLAVLRRLKTLDPSLITVMGGANCEGIMGVTLARHFEWVDYVVSGEADKLAVPFFVSLLEGEQAIPYGVISQDPASWTSGPAGQPPRATFQAMDQTAVPDFDDYFRALEASSLDLLPGLLVETSRGCWWGQKHHCTFCGLNGSGMGYRSKSGERVLQEMESLAQRYQLGSFEVVDNILDHAHLKTIMPVLAARPQPFEIFYETKSNLKREQIQLLAQAGVLWIQPGIESMHDEILRLMDKGSSALMNVQLLQHAREFGVRVIWNFLICFPGERDEWYTEMSQWLPLIHHLQPANGLAPIRYDRFSPYHTDPAKYGIRIQAARSYQAVYPLPPQELENLAYFFEDYAGEGRREDRRLDTPGRVALSVAVKEWREAFWSPLPPILSMSDSEEGLFVLDTRALAVERRHRLQGRSRELLLECRTPRRFLEPEPALLELVDKKLVLVLNDRYLSLPVEGDLPTLPASWKFPGGYPERPASQPPYRVPEGLRGALA